MGVIPALAWPWLIGPKPDSHASTAIKLDFVTKGALLVLFSVFCFAMACLGAALIIRAARNEFMDARTDNLKELIEGTQEDIRRKQGSPEA